MTISGRWRSPDPAVLIRRAEAAAIETASSSLRWLLPPPELTDPAARAAWLTAMVTAADHLLAVADDHAHGEDQEEDHR
ncbi:hypothetical protein [Streptomyces otsuchiensis]|uniref:hypothetical protein n=1 Tax=Streptomyces otsuchiensis TaxID=2681388 RepID=UPI00102F430D|nr:hypothetical protein [Streptomyces otsuchiensis]